MDSADDTTELTIFPQEPAVAVEDGEPGPEAQVDGKELRHWARLVNGLRFHNARTRSSDLCRNERRTPVSPLLPTVKRAAPLLTCTPERSTFLE